MRVIAAIAFLLFAGAAACSSGHASTSTSPSKPATVVEPKAGNPVDLIHKVGAKTGSTVGEPDLFGARSAYGWWGSTDPVTDPVTGRTSWGSQLDVTTFATHDLAAQDLGRRNPEDHTALLAGDLWVIRMTSGQQLGVRKFIPSPQTVAAQLGGQVIQVWP